MPSKRLLPYAFSDQGIKLEVVAIKLDGVDCTNSLLEDSDLAVDLKDEEWEDAELDFQVSYPAVLPLRLLPEAMVAETGELNGDGELNDGLCGISGLVLVLQDQGSRLRMPSAAELVFQGSTKDPGRRSWTITQKVRRADLRGTLNLDAYLVRTSDCGAEKPGFARYGGERVADSNTVNVYVDEGPDISGNGMGKFENFAESEAFKKYKDCVHYVDFSDPAKPEVYINSGIDGVKELLKSTAKKGRVATSRDVLAHSIVQGALMQLLTVALEVEAVRREEGRQEQEGDEEAAAAADSWSHKILKHFAMLVHKDVSENLAKQTLLDEYDDDSQRNGVMSRLGVAVQRHLSMRDSVERFIKLGAGGGQ